MNYKATKFLNYAALAVRSLHLSANRSVYTQVNRSTLSSSFSVSRFQSLIKCGCYNQSLFFSSNPETLLEMFSSNDSIEKLKIDIENIKLDLTHESAMYVLKKLNKDPIKSSVFFKWAVKKDGFTPSSSMYSLMLRIYAANKDTLKEFWVTIEEMKKKGFYIDEETFSTIYSLFRSLKMNNEPIILKHFYTRLVKENTMDNKVKEVVDVIKGDEWGETIEEKLREMNIIVSDNLMLRILKGLRGEGCTPKSYRFFKWVEQSLGFKHNSVTYNGVLRVLCREESINEFWNAFMEMKTAGFQLDIDTYVKVSRQFQKNKMFEEAVKLYEHMMDSPYKPSLNECTYLVHTLARYDAPDIGLVYRVVKKYEAAGNSLSKALFDGIHRSLTSLGRFEEAEEIIERMRKSGYEPDNITYSHIVFGLCKFNRLDEAVDVLESMEKQGCAPDIMSWTILIKGHIKANETDKALVHFTKMMEKGIDPDADLLEAIVKELSNGSRTTDALKILVELEEKVKLKPWQSTFKYLIQHILNERRFEEAIKLLVMMKKHEYPPFCEPFFEYISKFGSVDDAMELLSALTAKEHPSVSSYEHVFRAFFNENRLSEARDMFFKCPHHIRKHPAICSLFDSSG